MSNEQCPGCDNCLGTEAKVFRCNGDGILGDERALTAAAFEVDQARWQWDERMRSRYEAGFGSGPFWSGEGS